MSLKYDIHVRSFVQKLCNNMKYERIPFKIIKSLHNFIYLTCTKCWYFDLYIFALVDVCSTWTLYLLSLVLYFIIGVATNKQNPNFLEHNPRTHVQHPFDRNQRFNLVHKIFAKDLIHFQYFLLKLKVYHIKITTYRLLNQKILYMYIYTEMIL